MYSQFGGKPLHLPKPHHASRRGAAATETLRAALARPSDRGPRRTRTAAERRASRQRLAARREGGAPSASSAAVEAAVTVLWVLLALWALGMALVVAIR